LEILAIYRVNPPTNPVLIRRIMAAEVLQDIAELVRPGVDSFVHAENLVSLANQPQRQIGTDLPA
jgi:hypothetical protein